MSPIAKTSGWPGSVQSSRTTMRPARSHVAPLASASRPASGEACTPAAQIFVRQTTRSVDPSGPRTSTPNASTPVTIDPVRIVTPSRRSSLAAFAESRSPNVARISLPPSTNRTSALAGSMRRKLPLRPVREQLGDLPGDLDPGRAASDHDEGQPRATRLRVLLVLRHLEGAEDPPAQLQGVVDGLHARRERERTRRARSTTARRPRRRSGCRTRGGSPCRRGAGPSPCVPRGRTPAPWPSPRPRWSAAAGCPGSAVPPPLPTGFPSPAGRAAAGRGGSSWRRPA